MLSIENTYSIEELKKYGQGVEKRLAGEKVEWVIEYKIDGVAVSVTYENGRLTQAASRGNGRVGDDITHNVPNLENVPRRLAGKDPPAILELRGEVYMTNSDLVRLNEQQKAKGLAPYANTRNLAAGTIRLLDPALSRERRLKLFVHGVGYTEGFSPATHMEFLDEIRRRGLAPTPRVECFSSFADAVDHCEAMIEQLARAGFRGRWPGAQSQ